MSELNKTPTSKTREKRGKPFEKGNKLGKGRPKNADSIAVFVRNFLEQKNRREQLLDHAFAQSLDANDTAAPRWAEFLFNRAYGTPVNSIELSGKDGEPLELKVVIAPDFADDSK